MKYKVIIDKKPCSYINSTEENIKEEILKSITLASEELEKSEAVKLKEPGIDLYRLTVGENAIVFEIKDQNLIVLVARAATRGDEY